MQRGLAQNVCAQLAGISPSMLCRIEKGERSLERRAHIDALAGVRQISTAELLGQPYEPPGRSHSIAQAQVEGIRSALMGAELGTSDFEPFRPVEQLDELVTSARLHLMRHGDVPAAAVGQGEYLTELHAHVAAADSDERRAAALRTLVVGCCTSATTAKWLGYPELGWIAATRARQAAGLLDDPALIGFAEIHVSYTLQPYAQALTNTARAIDNLAGAVGDDPLRMQVLGMLHLTAALDNAVADRTANVATHLAEVDDLAARTGDRTDLEMYFGPTNAAIWSMAIALEQGESRRAREAARSVSAGSIVGRSRKATYFQDLGRALAADGRPREAVHAMLQAERLNPVEIRNNVMGHQVVIDLLPQVSRSAGGIELRALAHRMGII
jgi:transcriptional regulator with XRE-family HTH domain